MSNMRGGEFETPALGPVDIQTVGNTSRSTGMDAKGRDWTVRLGLLLDDACEAVPYVVDVRAQGAAPDTVALCAAAMDVLRANPVSHVFLVMGSAEMERARLSRRLEYGPRMEAARREALEGRVTALDAVLGACRQWCGETGARPLPALAVDRKEEPWMPDASALGDTAAVGAMILAARSGAPTVAVSFPPGLDVAGAAVAAATGAGFVNATYVSCRFDPGTLDRTAWVPRTDRANGPAGLERMASSGDLNDDTLLVAELCAPVAESLSRVASALERGGTDPVMLAFGPREALIGRASELAALLSPSAAPAP